MATNELSINSVVLEKKLIPCKFEDYRLVPRQAKELFQESLQRRGEEEMCEMIAAVGSTENIYSCRNVGLLDAVLTAYNCHWKLRTSPDDWWFCVIKRVANAIDKNAKKESVRKMFVDHEGKKTIQVTVPATSIDIYTVDYSWFFDQIAEEIQENVKVPEFVDGMTADFSTTTAVRKIVSQITLMYSVQEYFEYVMCTLCGIPAVEMLGPEDDWMKLKSKLKVLRTLLEPIEKDLGLESKWWDLVEKVFRKLLATYQGRPDRKWWSHVISKKAFGSGKPSKYKGWMIEFLEGKDAVQIDDISTGLVTVPLTIVDAGTSVKDSATLVAGMLGFTVHTDDTAGVSVQPFQGWSLLLSKESPFHRKEQKLAAEQDDADEDMWVASDLESDSELEEEEEQDGGKNENDQNDSSGEFSSEDEKNPVNEKKEDGLKRTLEETEKSKRPKKVKVSRGKKSLKETDVKQPSVKQHKKTKPKKSKS